jgi:hypothetical protein
VTCSALDRDNFAKRRQTKYPDSGDHGRSFALEIAILAGRIAARSKEADGSSAYRPTQAVKPADSGALGSRATF